MEITLGRGSSREGSSGPSLGINLGTGAGQNTTRAGRFTDTGSQQSLHYTLHLKVMNILPLSTSRRRALT